MSAVLFGSACRAGALPEAETPLEAVAGVPEDDRARCDFSGRLDREVVESKGPRSRFPNVRRVYGVFGEGDERRRVLLCREIDSNLDGKNDVVRTYNDHGEPLNELADSDFDGKIDTWITFARARPAKIQIAHGTADDPDETRLYMGTALSRAQRDTDHDGEPDVWEVYADGRLQRMGVDLDGDGRVDRWDRDETRASSEEDEASTAAPAPPSAAPLTPLVGVVAPKVEPPTNPKTPSPPAPAP